MLRCFIGAAIGARLGYLSGGEKGAILGAGAGALVGGASGFAYANHVASRKKEYFKQGDYIDALVASAKEVNQKSDTLRQEMANLEELTTPQLLYQSE